MSEQETPQIPVADLLNSLVEVETPYDSLGNALKGEGYEIFVDNNREKRAIILISASREALNHRNNSAVALVLTKDGVIHAPEYDVPGDQGERFGEKLVRIEIPQYENSVTFTFEIPTESSGRTRVRLATRCVSATLKD